MRLPVHLEQLRRVDVRVALRRAQARVAEQLLDRAQVGAALQQMRRERVAERVRADAGARAARRDVAPHEPVDAPRGQPCPRGSSRTADRVAGASVGARGSARRAPAGAARATSASRSFRYARSAAAVLVLNGTSRSLPPLPSTRTILRAQVHVVEIEARPARSAAGLTRRTARGSRGRGGRAACRRRARRAARHLVLGQMRRHADFALRRGAPARRGRRR